MLLKFTVKQRRGKIVKPASFGDMSGCFEAFIITEATSHGFSENNMLQKFFEFIAVLNNQSEIHYIGIIFKGLLPFQAFRIRMNIMTVIKSHHLEIFLPQDFKRINGTGRTTGVKQDFQSLLPKIAVPIRTRVAPSSIATG
jgi:hypothetical protein